MAKDILGYNRNIKTSSLPTGSCLLLTVGGRRGDAALVEQVSLQYGHQIQSQPVCGSNALYLLHGIPQGTLDVRTLVGNKGFFGMLGNPACGNPVNGNLDVIDVNGCNVETGSGVSLSGMLAVSVSVSCTAQDLKISSGAQFFVGMVN